MLSFRGQRIFLQRFSVSFGIALTAIAALGLSSSLVGQGTWFLEGAAYFIPCYAAFSLAGVVSCLAGRAWRFAVLSLVCLTASVAAIAPCYFPAPNRAAPGQTPNLRILTANLYEHHGNAKALLDLVRETNPDLIVLQEFDEEWAERLRPLDALYPHHAVSPRYPGGGGDLGQYWRGGAKPLRELADEGLPATETLLEVNGRAVRVINAHTAAPFTSGRAKRYREQMDALARYAAGSEEPVVLAGDLNSGPWSKQYRILLREGDLSSARQGLGVLGTWPSFFGLLRSGLDHILASPEIQVVRCWVASGISSDHRPLIADLYIPQSL